MSGRGKGQLLFLHVSSRVFCWLMTSRVCLCLSFVSAGKLRNVLLTGYLPSWLQTLHRGAQECWAFTLLWFCRYP